jgi:hypothetical protein
MPPTKSSPSVLDGVTRQKRDTKPYTTKPGPTPKDPAAPSINAKHKTTALDVESKSRLTMGDWLSVFQWKDDHKATQTATVNEFKSRTKGRLVFSQGALSEALQRRPDMEARVNENAINASRSRARVVVCPQVEKALFYWSKSMEERNELVTQAMLVAKRVRLEEQMDIPDQQRLGNSTGWVQSFCKM